MKIPVRLFARAQELAGAQMIEVQVNEPATVANLRTAMTEQFPSLATLSASLLIAVDAAYAQDADLLASTAEVACFPPVSGG